MPIDTKSGTQTSKVCAKCGIDVTSQRRFKDAAGHYFCADCNALAASKPAVMSEPPHASSRSYGLIPRVTCPHCWHVFGPQETMWIAAHSDLVGDPVLGAEKSRRFAPTRFTVEGQALDARGVPCQLLACPHCHLGLPRSTIEAEPLFLSIVGGPKTGKSYFLAAMTWELRKRLPGAFAIAFSDADTVSNQQLTDYEESLFLPEDPEKLVTLPSSPW